MDFFSSSSSATLRVLFGSPSALVRDSFGTAPGQLRVTFGWASGQLRKLAEQQSKDSQIRGDSVSAESRSGAEYFSNAFKKKAVAVTLILTVRRVLQVSTDLPI